MRLAPWRRLSDAVRRLRRFERREVREFRRWLETTSNLLHVSVLLFVPLLIAFVTFLSNAFPVVSFLLFPPLASGTYTLFADPEGRYSSPWRFVGGLTAGALCGWVALEFSALFVYDVPLETFSVRPGAAALGVLLTGAVTWALDVELPTAYSTALLVLVTGTSQFGYVVAVALSSAVVAGAFAVWREEFYEERARYLYRTTGADDHVLVPMRGETAAATAMFGARIAAAHDAGKVVLLDVVDDEAVARAERAALDTASADVDVEDAASDAEERAAAEAAGTLEARAGRIETEAGVPCEVVVAVGTDAAATATRAARETNCDLIVTPYEERRGRLAPFVRDLFRNDIDVVAFRSTTGRTEWRRVLVPVRRASAVAHAMLDYADRLAGAVGTVSVCHCIESESQRRRSESMLANLAETVRARCETRVSRSDIASFLERNDAHYDVVLLGASTDRSAASRFVSPPTFERIERLETDVAVVHMG